NNCQLVNLCALSVRQKIRLTRVPPLQHPPAQVGTPPRPPISRGSRRFHRRFSLCFAEDLLYQRLETRLVANAVVDLVDLQIPTGAVLLLIRFFQPIQNFLSVAKSETDGGERCRTNVLVFREVFEFVQDLLAFRSISGGGIGVAEVSLIPGSGIRRFSFLEFRDRAGRVTLLKEREA